MPKPLEVEHAETFPVDPATAYAAVLPTPLEKIFDRRFWAIPPISEVREQSGPWDAPGRTRTIVLADGGSMREELLEVEEPHAFSYHLTDVTGPMKPLVAEVVGRWSFVPDGAGTRITWRWTVHPRSAASAVAMPVFAWLWRGNARLGFERIRGLLGA